MSGEAELDKMIARIRALPEAMRETAPACASAMRTEFEANIAAGRSADGVAWPLRKEGGRALQNAGAALTVNALGTTVVAVLSGPEAIHHYGTWKDPRRPILPRGDLPPTLSAAFRQRYISTFRKTMGAR